MIQESRHPDAARSGQGDDNAAWSREAFEAKLRERGKSYHIHHPFNVMLNTGKATPEQVRGWVANRFYYQIAIPIKDGAVLSNCPDAAVRRGWVQRILDHDGAFAEQQGLADRPRRGEDAQAREREVALGQQLEPFGDVGAAGMVDYEAR